MGSFLLFPESKIETNIVRRITAVKEKVAMAAESKRRFESRVL